VRFAFIEAEKAFFPVRVLCRVLEVSASGFYAWRARPESTRAQKDRELRAEIAAVHSRSRGTYGSPRIHAELHHRHQTSRKRIARLMRNALLVGHRPRRHRVTTDSRHQQPVARNLVKRKFDVAAPNRLWATDITYVRTWEGWLYLAVVIDLFSRRVIGWSMADHMRTELAVDALRMALGQRARTGELVHHSDRGTQYASDRYRRILDKHRITCSMSRRGNCWDNAVVESFFATLKVELVDRKPWPTRQQARLAIHDYIVTFYNPNRRHSRLGYLTPMEYEQKHEMRRLRVA
jgi:putative transposase